MIILNLGCGNKTSNVSSVVNIDWSMYLRLHNNRIGRLIAPLFLYGNRLSRFKELPNNILVHDLTKGIPFGSDSVDVVYHSHVLEHMDRNIAEEFLLECRRVLKPGGIHRIVVPDFAELCNEYIEHIWASESNIEEAKRHDEYVACIIEQSIRKEASGASRQIPLIRFIENIILGDARKRGETHQWMYDRINLPFKLAYLGFRNVVVCDYRNSFIPNWNELGLDVNESGSEHKPRSLYIESVK